jgi:hypothetical protein
MFAALAWALIAAVVLAVVSLIFNKPRTTVTKRGASLVRRVQLRLYLQRREDTQRAIERMAAELAERRCSQEAIRTTNTGLTFIGGSVVTRTRTSTTAASSSATLNA